MRERRAGSPLRGHVQDWLAAALLLTALGCAHTPRGQELLLQSLPDGYHIVSGRARGPLQVAEMVPEGETAQNWTERITTQIFRGGVPEQTPEKYFETVYAEYREHCPRSITNLLRTGEENGYPFAFWMHQCELDRATGQPEFIHMKAIQGRDSFYVIQKTWLSHPDDDAIREGAEFMRSIEVCNTSLPEHACPGGIPG